MTGEKKKCGCFSGLTDQQAVLVELSGMLEMVEWKVHTAMTSFLTQQTPKDKVSAEYLRKVGDGLKRLRKWTTENAWRPQEKP